MTKPGQSMTFAHQRMVRVPRLSILVPFPQSNSFVEKAFEDTLASVLQNRPTDSEVLVSHAGAYDDPYDLSGEVRFLEHRPDTSLVDLVNCGLDRARSEVLHVVTPGHFVSEGWADEAVAAFKDPGIGTVVPVIVSQADPSHALNCGVGYSCGGARWIAGVGQSVQTIATKTPATLGPSLAAGFFRTDAVCSLEGFSAELGDALADVDLALSLQAIGYRTAISVSSVIRTCLPPQREPASFLQGQHAERLFRRHCGQLGWLRSMIAHPLTILIAAIAEIPHPGAVTQVAGRCSTWFEQRSQRRYQELLEEARDEAALVPHATLSISARDTQQNPSRQDPRTSSRRAA